MKYYVHYLILAALTSATTTNARHTAELDTWSYGQMPMPKGLSDMSSCYHMAPDDEGDWNVGIYLFGGCKKGYDSSTNLCVKVSDATYFYDYKYGGFSQRRTALRKRYRHESVAYLEYIWVLGGRDEDDNLVHEIDIYHPYHDIWFTIASLPPPISRSDFVMMSHGTFIYFMGGYNDDYVALEDTYVIDAEKSIKNYYTKNFNKNPLVLQRLADMSIPRGDINAALYGRYIYIMGGYTHQDSFCNPLALVEAYDTELDEWVRVQDMVYPRADMSVIKFKSMFYVIGGETAPEIQSAQCQDQNFGENLNYRDRYVSSSWDIEPSTSIEIYNPKEGIPSRFSVIDTITLPRNESFLRFTVATWPDVNAVFLFGGVRYNGDHEKCDEETERQKGCLLLKASDSVLIFVAPEEVVEMADFSRGGVGWDDIWKFMVFSVISFVVVALVFCVRKKACTNDNDQEEEQQQQKEGEEDAFDLTCYNDELYDDVSNRQLFAMGGIEMQQQKQDKTPFWKSFQLLKPSSATEEEELQQQRDEMMMNQSEWSHLQHLKGEFS